MTNTINDEMIQKRKNIFEQAIKNLKSYFVGIDKQIDQIKSIIETWWVYPEFMNRPLVINLWGITGVGKTDLVRKLAYELGIYDKFCQIEIDKTQDDPYSFGITKSILGKLFNYNINTNVQGILLIDDIHRYQNTSYMNDKQYDDIWQLISDGKVVDSTSKIKFLNDVITELRSFIARKYSIEYPSRNNNVYDDSYPRMKFSWHISRYINTIGLNDNDRQFIDILNNKTIFENQANTKTISNYIVLMNSINENDIVSKDMVRLQMISDEDLLIFLSNKYNELISADTSKGVNEEDYIYSKLLIFITGNLDTVFYPKTDKPLNEITPEELYEHTSKVEIKDIKHHLSDILRPEFIARLGNNHIIFHSLLREDYKKITKRIVQRSIEKTKNKYNIDIYIDSDKIFEIVEKDIGLYPYQGVRSVISSVNMILNQEISYILSKEYENSH